ncbi:hypothetical protein AB0I28_36445 [Phytomonospora sp. NPDC050363]|uniref:hypothetical protein n=1 Tax=Phytomonospora sp. NPDC050363 TaxID=3155642 RepID=UPI0033F210C7
MRDALGEIGRVPEFLERVERADDPEAWRELEYRLCLEHDLVPPAGFAALPRLVPLAVSDRRARRLAGLIVRCSAGHHRCDALLAGTAAAIADFGGQLDRHLRTRPADYLDSFIDLLAVAGQYHWSAALGDFSDDFYPVDCPHCAVKVMIAIGDYGRYSAIRDWDHGDVDRRPLRPAFPAELTGTGRWMYDTAARDGQAALAEGIAHLHGRAECPRCAALFTVADEYAAANLPRL